MLHSDVQTSKSLNVLKNEVLKFILPKANYLYNSLNSEGVKSSKSLRLGLSHPQYQRLKHSFQSCVSSI